MVTRNEAKKLANTVTTEELKQMFLNAQSSIKDWTKVSRVNKGLTKGTSFNILTKCNIDAKNKLATVNMIWEFGEYLPNFMKEIIEKKSQPKPTHQEPNKLVKEDLFDNLFN